MSRSNKYRYKILQYKSDTPKPRKNEIVIIPQDNRLMEIPPYLNQNTLPSWWASLPKSKGSLRRCQGTYDYLNYGFTIPLWTDVHIRPGFNGKENDYMLAQFGEERIFRIEGFNESQATGCPFGSQAKNQQSGYPKLVSPWRYFTPKGVSLLALPILHEPNPNYIVMPGMVHTDFYNQIHIVLKILSNEEFIIKAGTPIQHMIPVKRNENIKRIIWGNDSMYKFHKGQGMGKGCLQVDDNSHLYRKIQREIDQELEI